MSVTRPLINPVRHLTLAAYDLASYLAEKNVEELKKMLEKVITDFRLTHYYSSFFYTLEGVAELSQIAKELTQENILEKLEFKLQNGIFNEVSLNAALLRELTTELKKHNYDASLLSSYFMLDQLKPVFLEATSTLLEEERALKEKMVKEEELKELLEKTIRMEFNSHMQSMDLNIRLSQIQEKINTSQINPLSITTVDGFPVSTDDTELMAKQTAEIDKLFQKFTELQKEISEREEENNRLFREMKAKQYKYESEISLLNDKLEKLENNIREKRNSEPFYYPVQESKENEPKETKSLPTYKRPIQDTETLRKITNLNVELKNHIRFHKPAEKENQQNKGNVLNTSNAEIQVRKHGI